MTVNDASFYRRMLLHGDLGAAESYLRGEWETNDLLQLFLLLAQNTALLNSMNRGLGWLTVPASRLRSWLSRNTIAGSRRNIHAHYDLSNDFFRLFLDDTMTYSSGYYPNEDSTLREASIEKYDRICRRLGLTSQHHLLEIGTGWGGFVKHAVENYNCRITTTTISREQHRYAADMLHRHGLTGRIELLLQDYRQLAGQYDAIVSIEMIEAVGHEFLPTFFHKCHSLLKPGGDLLLQAITIPDQRYEAYRKSTDFIQRYIFPGGCLPSIGALQQAASTTADLQLEHFEDFGSHYARTLAAWRERFWERIDDVRALGLDERFIRMWDYYLAYCEAGFRTRMTGVAHLHYRK
ncbi:MAG: class I SAM-dependent methyltransferase [Planctomycetales bacterium]|nr:class I SAM-dependent methyltransferase [Planctomycetales bacterium]